MKKSYCLLGIVGLIGLGMAFVENPAQGEKDDGEHGEQQISVQKLPPAIRRALKDIKIGQLSEIEMEKSKKGVVTYEVELRIGKQDVGLKLSRDGKLLGVEIESGDDEDDDDKSTKRGKGKRKKKKDDDD